MAFSLILENEYGDKADMSTTALQYMTSSIQGLDPPTGTIALSKYAGMSGSYLNTAYMQNRNVVVNFAMRGTGIEARRHALYQVARPAHPITVYYKTKLMDVYTEGHVETCEIENFEQYVSGQISIICPDIYWYDMGTTTATRSPVAGGFHFPFPDSDDPFELSRYTGDTSIQIMNGGDNIGFTLTITASGSASNPYVVDPATGEYFRLRTSMSAGDIITIDTKSGEKSVTLAQNNVASNLINSVVSGSTWLSLKPGTNLFDVGADSGDSNLTFAIIHRNAYLGV